MSIGIGIIGLGWISQKIYLPYFLNNEAVNKIVIYDIDLNKTKNTPIPSSVLIVNTLEALLSLSDIDAVFIATPNFLHCEHIIKALQADKIVFCDKPICINKEQVKSLEDINCLYPDRLFPLLPNRFRQDIQYIKSVLENDDIGNVYKIKAHWIRDSGIPGSSWFLDSKKAGGGY
ncbi:Inositol 2-dehydrogenase [Paenibacillus nuruki]|uniref:Inositol 2-dehydrogenase n=1 Tax=Paenibacillus nuruki TaxID=1886670 RepID=A0A1E3KXK2_9BACL|nr:Gfo/Idh/MocA family oxidoreductase [Paenibacillus nuruki]ODP26041.1 Inositol 2-dehydrogenase [Paenibacillus nuruki]